MWQWIKNLFGFKKLCRHEERAKLLECCNHNDAKVVKKQINAFIKARKADASK